MPLYEYECSEPECRHITEIYYPQIPRFINRSVPCEECGAVAKKIISKPNVQEPYPKWIDSNLRASIQDDDEPPIESRHDLNRVTKQKNLVENPKNF